MKVTVDAETCIGCGVCEDLCPQVFEMSDDEKAEAKAGDVPPEAEDTCRDAVEECPVEAISIEP